MTLRARARLVVRFATEAEARIVLAALAPENAGFVRASVEGAAIVAEADAAGPGPLLHTLDDLLASLSAAERVLPARG